MDSLVLDTAPGQYLCPDGSLSPDASGWSWSSDASGWCLSPKLRQVVFVFGLCLSPDISGQCLSLGGISSMTVKKWISDIILFPSSLLFHAESF